MECNKLKIEIAFSSRLSKLIVFAALFAIGIADPNTSVSSPNDAGLIKQEFKKKKKVTWGENQEKLYNHEEHEIAVEQQIHNDQVEHKYSEEKELAEERQREERERKGLAKEDLKPKKVEHPGWSTGTGILGYQSGHNRRRAERRSESRSHNDAARQSARHNENVPEGNYDPEYTKRKALQKWDQEYPQEHHPKVAEESVAEPTKGKIEPAKSKVSKMKGVLNKVMKPFKRKRPEENSPPTSP